MKKKSLTLILLIILFGFIVISPSLFQEGNPLPILKGIVELSIGNYDIVKITDETQRYISKTDKGNSPMINLMGEDSWEFYEQMGSGYIFHKDEDRKIVSSVQYIKKHVIWEVPREEID